jgi:hypothetical protein
MPAAMIMSCLLSIVNTSLLPEAMPLGGFLLIIDCYRYY